VPEQERKQAEKREQDRTTEAEQADAATKGEKLKEEMDDILDEIDSVLEENAEEFIKSYVQKGGE
jgi:prokaryotic ubiquitin-like protein Pup